MHDTLIMVISKTIIRKMQFRRHNIDLFLYIDIRPRSYEEVTRSLCEVPHRYSAVSINIPALNINYYFTVFHTQL